MSGSQEKKKSDVNQVVEIVEIAEFLTKKEGEGKQTIQPVTPLDEPRTPFEPKET